MDICICEDFYVFKAVVSLKYKPSVTVFGAIVIRGFDSEIINILSDDTFQSVLSIIQPMMETIHNNNKENMRLTAF